jgi:hypothetical protein
MPDPEPSLPVRTIVASVLSLLAFILGITFSLASSHFDARGEAVTDEAIAIGSAYHRAELLAEPDRTTLRNLLREYVDLRLEAAQLTNSDDASARLRQLQKHLWDEAVIIEKQDGGTRVSMLQPLTDIIDVHAERVLAVFRARIPDIVWFFLYGIMVVALIGAGYQSGISGGSRSISGLVYSLVFAGVIVLIAGADNPRPDQLRSSHQALTEQRARLTSP